MLESPQIQRRAAETDDDGDTGKIVGYAVKWNQFSSPMMGFQEKFAPGAFTRSLADKTISVYAAWNHDSSEILGRAPSTLTLVEDDIGLRYEINPPAWAERYLETIERGDVTGSSFMFRATKQEWDDTDPNVLIRTITEAELYEVSPVTTPAYPSSSVGVRSAEQVLNEYQQQHRGPDPKETELRNIQRARALDLKRRVL